MISHTPVLIEEILSIMVTSEKTFHKVIDATLGLGGYSETVLKKWEDVSLLGIDQDEDALKIARERLAPFGNRVHFVSENFSSIFDIAQSKNFLPSDALFFDLGVSNLQLSLGERGFSYQNDGPLDMRMNRSNQENPNAYDVFNFFPLEDLVTIFRKYGEERHAYKFAKILVEARENKGALQTTGDVIQALREGLPAPFMRKLGRHPGRKLFQAVRIFVNSELEVLETSLEQVPSVLSPEGLLFMVTYHSLEDRIVKHTMRTWQQQEKGETLFKKPIVPSESEVEGNYKSRSAKLRVFHFYGEGREKLRGKFAQKKERI